MFKKVMAKRRISSKKELGDVIGMRSLSVQLKRLSMEEIQQMIKVMNQLFRIITNDKAYK